MQVGSLGQQAPDGPPERSILVSTAKVSHSVLPLKEEQSQRGVCAERETSASSHGGQCEQQERQRPEQLLRAGHVARSRGWAFHRLSSAPLPCWGGADLRGQKRQRKGDLIRSRKTQDFYTSCTRVWELL